MFRKRSSNKTVKSTNNTKTTSWHFRSVYCLQYDPRRNSRVEIFLLILMAIFYTSFFMKLICLEIDRGYPKLSFSDDSWDFIDVQYAGH